MSLALKLPKGDYIYFDAVLSYGQSFPNQVSKHPVDGGSKITDHITMDNPTYSINGVISAVDFNDTRGGSINSKYIFANTNPITNGVQISNKTSPLKDLPFVSGIVKSPSPPSITLDEGNATVLQVVRDILEDLRDNSKNAANNYGIFSIIEFNNGNISGTPKENCVLVGLEFNETPETGNCLDVSLTIEQVTFVQLVKAKFSKSVSISTKDAASPEQSKGSQPGVAVSSALPAPTTIEKSVAKQMGGNFFEALKGRK